MPLPTATPSAHGVDASGITAFVEAVDAATFAEPHSLAIARHGHTIAEGWWSPYRADRVHLLYSLSKSLTATTVATLVADGTIGLDDPVLRHLPTSGIDIDPRWEAVLVKHCLSMTVGHTTDAWGAVMMSFAAGEPAGFLELTLRNGPDAEPGTVFCYNQVATYVLSRIVANVTGRNLGEVARERILDPLGAGELLWHRDPEGFELGFTGAHLRTTDLLSLVQLWLDRGTTPDGVELVPAAWYDSATVPFVAVPPGDPPDWSCGYGYSYWIARHGYRGDGAFGQYGIVLPEHGVAVAMTGATVEMQAVLDLAWQHLLPTLDRPGSAAADDELAARLAGLEIPALGGRPAAGTFNLSGDLPADWSAISIAAGQSRHDLTFTVDGAEAMIPVGNAAWADGDLVVGGRRLPTAASGGWRDTRFVADVRCAETPHTLRLEADAATGEAEARWVLPPLTGPDPRVLAVRPA